MADINFDDPLLQDAIIKRLTKFQEISDGLYDTVTRDNLIEWYNKYYADEDYYNNKFPNLSKSSKLISTDIADTIEWALPSLMRIFFGSDKVISIAGRSENGEDDRSAKLMEELINFQLTSRNNAFLVFYNWFKDSLITGLGIVKAYWYRESEDKIMEEVFGIDALQQLSQNENVEILDYTPQDDTGIEFMVKYKVTTPVVSEPRIENILASEFRYLPRTRDIKNSPFVAHKKKVTLDYLRKMEKEGMYSNISKVEESGEKSGIEDEELEETVDETYGTMFRYSYVENVDQEYDLWEQYIDIDLNNDGMSEKWIITTCGDVILRIEENKYGRPPFFLLSPSKDPHRLWPKRSYADLIGQLQDLKVALTRQLVKGIALSNEPRVVIDEEAINLYDFIDGKNYIRKKPGVPMDNALYPIPNVQLHPWTFQMLEYVDTQKENRTGITKYNQGLDAKSLNKTASGISQIMSASNQRLELMARMFAETEIKELYTFLIMLNQKFLDMRTMVRLTNEIVWVDGADLGGGYDLVVNAGIGMGTKEMKMLNLQTIGQTLIGAANMGLPIVNPANFYNLYKKMFIEMGEKNVSDYLTPPEQVIMEQMMEAFQKLPPELQQMVATGNMTLQEATNLFQGAMINGQTGITTPQTQTNGASQQGGVRQASPSVSQGVAGQRKRGDNRIPQTVPREPTQ